jgi:hypothetical protein
MGKRKFLKDDGNKETYGHLRGGGGRKCATFFKVRSIAYVFFEEYLNENMPIYSFPKGGETWV